MKRFLLNSFFFLFPILLVVSLVEYTTRQIPNEYSYKNEYLKKHSDEVEVLVLGSSHSLYDINPDFIEQNAFNAAHAGQSFNYDLFILKKYINQMPQFKTVILPVSYFSFFLEDPERIKKNYNIYYDCPLYSSLKYHSEFLSINEKTWKRLLGNTILYWKNQKPNNVSLSDSGFGLRYKNKPPSDLKLTAKQAIDRHTVPENDLKNEKHFNKKLGEIIKECETKEVNVILFTPPAWKEYEDQLNKKQLDLMKHSIHEIAEKYKNVNYFSFMNDNRFKKEDYRDADHLNIEGAKKFTKLLNEIVNDKK